MKKLISLPAVIFFVAFLISSCEKNGITKTKVVNIELAANTNFSYEIPYDGDDQIGITQQGSHFLKSEISRSGSTVMFNYTPALNYVGNDEVKVRHEDEAKMDCGTGNGNNSGHDDDDVTVYVFKITVKGNTK